MALEKRDLNGEPADYDTELKAFVGEVPKQPEQSKEDEDDSKAAPRTPTKKKP